MKTANGTVFSAVSITNKSYANNFTYIRVPCAGEWQGATHTTSLRMNITTFFTNVQNNTQADHPNEARY